jgi:hypothetical protein
LDATLGKRQSEAGGGCFRGGTHAMCTTCASVARTDFFGFGGSPLGSEGGRLRDWARVAEFGEMEAEAE